MVFEWDGYRIRVDGLGVRSWFVQVPDPFGTRYWSSCESADDDLLDDLFSGKPVDIKLIESVSEASA